MASGINNYFSSGINEIRAKRMAALWHDYRACEDQMGKMKILEEIFIETADSAENEVVRLIALKFLEKILLKANWEEIEQFRDDPDVFQKIKKLGVFLICHRFAEQKFKSKEFDFEINQKDSLIDIQLLPLDTENNKNFIEEAEKSFRLIAQYLIANNIKPKYIFGVTYEFLAGFSKHFGFKVARIPITKELLQAILEAYKHTGKFGNDLPMNEVDLIYEDYDSFMKKWQRK